MMKDQSNGRRVYLFGNKLMWDESNWLVCGELKMLVGINKLWAMVLGTNPRQLLNWKIAN
jgi:hypothetical protein